MFRLFRISHSHWHFLRPNNNNELFFVLSLSLFELMTVNNYRSFIFNSIFTHELMNRIISQKLIDCIYGYWVYSNENHFMPRNSIGSSSKSIDLITCIWNMEKNIAASCSAMRLLYHCTFINMLNWCPMWGMSITYSPDKLSACAYHLSIDFHWRIVRFNLE